MTATPCTHGAYRCKGTEIVCTQCGTSKGHLTPLGNIRPLPRLIYALTTGTR